MIELGFFAMVQPPDERSMLVTNIGCLTMIKGNHSKAWTPELTQAIQADERLPDDPQEDEFMAMSEPEQREFLQPFAEWWRKLNVIFDPLKSQTPTG